MNPQNPTDAQAVGGKSGKGKLVPIVLLIAMVVLFASAIFSAVLFALELYRWIAVPATCAALSWLVGKSTYDYSEESKP